MGRSCRAFILCVVGAVACDDDDGTREPSNPAEVPTVALSSPSQTWWSDDTKDLAGRGLDARDVDGDGRAEILIGTPWEDTYPVTDGDPGAYLVGADSASGVLVDVSTAAFLPGTHGESFGSDVSLPGDLTGDGIEDAVVIGVYDEAGAGQLTATGIFAGPLVGTRDAQDAVTTVTYNFDDGYAYWTTRCGDITGDGHADLCSGSGAGRTDSSAYVFPGPLAPGVIDLADVAIEVRAPPEEWAGQHMDGGVDLTGDGVDDLLVGANQRDDDTGGVYLVSSPAVGLSDLSEHPLWTGGSPGDMAGGSMALGGDLDGDGFEDFFVGAHMSDVHAGRGYVLTDKNGGPLEDASVVLAGADRYDWLGFDGAIGDFDGDGMADLAVGIPRDIYFGFDEPGRVAIFRGPLVAGSYTEEQASTLIRVSDLPDAFGMELVLEDVDGDGVDDVVGAAPYDATHGFNSGAVYVVLGGRP